MSNYKRQYVFAGKPYIVTLWEPGDPVMLCSGPICGVDSETTLIQNKHEWPQVVAAGFSCNGHIEIVRWQHLEEYQRRFLAVNINTKFAFFNFAFDANVMGRAMWLNELKKENRILELRASYKIYCVGSVGWIPRNVTLAYLTEKTLGVSLNKEDGTRTSFTRESELTEEQIHYLCEDCMATELCGIHYQNMPTETLQARASFVLSEISHNGMPVDVDFVNQKRQDILLQMADQAKTLRAFGFRLKRETEDMTQTARFVRALGLLGIASLDSRLQAVDKAQPPKSAIWLAAALLLELAEGGGALVSDYQAKLNTLVALLLKEDFDWSSKNAMLKLHVNNAKDVIREYLTKLECEDCIPDKNAKTIVALTIVELIAELAYQGQLLENMDAFDSEFKDRYDENLAWLPGTKPETCAKFLQRHLKNLKSNNPGLEFSVTESSAKNIKAYVRECNKKRVPVDAQKIEELSTYACKRNELWRLRDIQLEDPFLNVYTAYKHNEKLLSTYYTLKYLDSDGKNHPNFNEFLVTGRTSCSSPNLLVNF